MIVLDSHAISPTHWMLHVPREHMSQLGAGVHDREGSNDCPQASPPVVVPPPLLLEPAVPELVAMPAVVSTVPPIVDGSVAVDVARPEVPGWPVSVVTPWSLEPGPSACPEAFGVQATTAVTHRTKERTNHRISRRRPLGRRG